MDKTTRRDFIKQAAAGATLAALAEDVLAQTSPSSATGLPTRVLGSTGQRVSILCLGGWHIGIGQGRQRKRSGSCTPPSTRA